MKAGGMDPEGVEQRMAEKNACALDAAKTALRLNMERAPYLSDWCHVKSGGKFTVRMHVLIEATVEPAVIYYKKHSDPMETWCRPASEFFDGRFERIPNSLTT